MSTRGRIPGLDPDHADVEPRSLDRVFKALANPARRRMLDALRERPLTTGELADMFAELTRFTVMQHLKVLASARLVVTQKNGRERHHYLNTVPIQELYERWVRGFESLWSGSLTDLRNRLEAPGIPGLDSHRQSEFQGDSR